MTTKQTSFELSPAGTAIPTTGSAGDGDQFTAGSNGGGTAVVSASGVGVADGSLCARFTTDATGATVWRGWALAATSTPVFRGYIYFNTLPAARLDLVQLLTLSPTTNRARLAVSTAGQLQIINDSTIVATSAATMSSGTLYRIEADWTLALSGGSASADFYAGHATSPAGSCSATGLAYSSATVTDFRIGSPTSAIANLDFYTDAWAIADTGARFGPAGSTSLDKLRLGSGTVGLRVGSATPTAAYLGATQVWP